jgi:membrane protease YdiL (CAAX protease family)
MNNPLSQAGVELGDYAWIVGVNLGLVLIGMLIDVALLIYYYAHPPHWDENANVLRQKAAPTGFIARLLIVLFSILTIVLSLQKIVDFFGHESLLKNDPFWVLLQSLGFHWIGLLVIGLLLKRFGGTWKGVFGIQAKLLPKALGTGLVFYLAAMPFLWFYTLLYEIVLRYLGYEPSWQDIALVLTDAQPLWIRTYLFFMTIVLAPLFEEVLFRGILLPFLAQKWGVSRSIIAVSILFAAIHFHVPALVPLFVISLAFSLAYISTRSMLVPVVMHGIFNAVNLALMLALR